MSEKGRETARGDGIGREVRAALRQKNEDETFKWQSLAEVFGGRDLSEGEQSMMEAPGR